MYCHVLCVWGQAVAGGVLKDSANLTDNWDDAEGYYSECLLLSCYNCTTVPANTVFQ